MMYIPDEFSSQSGSSTDLTDIMKNEVVDGAAQPPSLGKCRALYTYEARLNDELTLSPGKIYLNDPYLLLLHNLITVTV